MLIAVDFNVKNTIFASLEEVEPSLKVKDVTFPTFIAFTNDRGILCGQDALEEARINPQNSFSGT